MAGVVLFGRMPPDHVAVGVLHVGEGADARRDQRARRDCTGAGGPGAVERCLHAGRAVQVDQRAARRGAVAVALHQAAAGAWFVVGKHGDVLAAHVLGAAHRPAGQRLVKALHGGQVAHGNLEPGGGVLHEGLLEGKVEEPQCCAGAPDSVPSGVWEYQ